MTFTKDSQLVKIWVSLVQNGTYMREQVPMLYNLQEVVFQVLDVEV